MEEFDEKEVICLNVQFMGKKQQVRMEIGSTLRQLQKHLEESTAVPLSTQKIVHRGRNLCQLDPDMTLYDCRLKNNHTLMLLGRPFDPQSDELMSTIDKIYDESQSFFREADALRAEIDELDKGYLEGSMFTELVSRLKRRIVGLSERVMKILERLDALSLATAANEVRGRRKFVATQLNELLDRTEQLSTCLEIIKRGREQETQNAS